MALSAAAQRAFSSSPEGTRILDDSMARALTLALRGPDTTDNPQVGCVIIDAEGRIVAEGWHRGAGTPHAEADALAQLSDTDQARAAELTAVVTMEPCNHRGRTGPCAQALIEAGIGAVAYGADDAAGASAGGAETLRAAGIQVIPHVLPVQTRALRQTWVDRTGINRAETEPVPVRVIAKWAQTLDGRVSAADGTSQWITGPQARADVHYVRARADLIVTTTATVLADDPALTARNPYSTSGAELLVPAKQQPLPVVFGSAELPASAKIFSHPALGDGEELPRFTGHDGLAEDFLQLAELARARHTEKTRAAGRPVAGQPTIYVEAGGRFLTSILRAGLVTDLHVYQAATLLGGPNTVTTDLGIVTLADRVDLDLLSVAQLGADLKLELTTASQSTKPTTGKEQVY